MYKMIIILFAVCSCLLSGCSLMRQDRYSANPSPAISSDNATDPNSMTAASFEPTGKSRPWNAQLAEFGETTITHEPLYFYGRYDDSTEFPINFSPWNKADRLVTLYAPAEAAIDLILLPWQLYQNPPCQPDISYSIYPFVAPTETFSPVTATEECGS